MIPPQCPRGLDVCKVALPHSKTWFSNFPIFLDDCQVFLEFLPGWKTTVTFQGCAAVSCSSLPVDLRRNSYKLFQAEARLVHSWANYPHHCCHHPKPILLLKHLACAPHCTLFLYHLAHPWRRHHCPAPDKSNCVVFMEEVCPHDKHGGCQLMLEEAVIQVAAGWPQQMLDWWNTKRDKK